MGNFTVKKSPVPMAVVAEATEMLYSDPVRKDPPCAKDPTVIKWGDCYYMYYTQPPYDVAKRPEGILDCLADWHCGIARSTDLINWTRVSDMDLRNTRGEIIGGDGAPCVKVFDGVIHMFYQRSWTLTGKNEIWHAVSTDGIRFTNTHDEPVFIPDNEWSMNRAIDAEVYRVKDKLVLMYATRDLETGKIQMIGMAEAPYGCDYGPGRWVSVSNDGPVIKPEYAWEGKCIEAPTVMEKNGVWYFFYAGSYNNKLQQIGLATSIDGYNFTRVVTFPDAPGLFYKVGTPGSWNQCESGHPGVFVDDDGQVYLFFQGKPILPGSSSHYSLSVLKLTFKP